MDFIEDDFPTRGEVDRNLQLYETLGQEEGALSGLVENEKEIPQTLRDSGSDLPPSGSISLVKDSQQPQLRRSKRGNLPRRRFEIEGEAYMIAPHDDDEPTTVQEALSSSAKDVWIKAMNDEIELMKTNQVWDLVNLPPRRKTIGNKWVLKVKRKANGSIERYKAPLVAKDYTQQDGIDYEETCSPVIRFPQFV